MRTDSINEAAFVVASGMSHPKFEWVTDNLCLFTWEKCDGVGDMIASYQKGGSIEARKFAASLSHLKSAMFKSKEN